MLSYFTASLKPLHLLPGRHIHPVKTSIPWALHFRLVCVLTHSVMSVCDLHGLQPTRLLCPWRFSSQEYWSGWPCPPPGDLPNPGIEPESPTLQVDSLPSESPGEPKNAGVGRLFLLQGIFPTQELNRGLLY